MIDKLTDNILLSSGLLNKEKEYWTQKLSGYIPSNNIFSANIESQSLKDKRKEFKFNFDEDTSNKISIMANKSQYGIYMTLLSGIFYTIHRYLECTDILIGTPVFKQKSMGKLLNYVLPLRMQMNDEMSFKEFITSTKNLVIEANENMNYPYEKMLDIVNCDKNNINNNLFNIFVKFNDIHDENFEFNPLCDFIFTFDWNGGNICCNLNYDQGVLSEEQVDSITQCYLNYFKSVLNNKNVRLDDIEILPFNEKSRILNEFNNTNVFYPKEKTLDELFEEQVEKTPDEVALVFEGKEITYRKLNEKANKTANLLKSKGIKKGDTVAIILPRSFEQIISLLGILKVGAICLPIDINYPKERIDYILKDSDTKMILKDVNTSLPIQGEFETFEMDDNILNTYSNEFVGERKSSENIAYIIYTSGSTGKPKGVLLKHYGIINHIYTKIRELKIDENDILCFSLNINFVASIWQIFTPLILGLKLFIYDEEIIRNAYELMQKVKNDKISIIEIVPTMLNLYLNLIEKEKEKIELNKLRTIVLTGERIQTTLIRKMFSEYRNSIELVNAYGQSECSDDTLHYSIPYDEKIEKVPIGKPSNNTKLFIMNKGKTLQPIGAIGELYISGDGLSGGYLNLKNLNNNVFVENPYLPGEIMYRTGDQVRWLQDGNVEYIGRIDQQVKVRGNRIELGEIEVQLLMHSEIKEAVVTATKDEQQNNYLCAYIVPKSDIKVNEVRRFLKESLPDYMLPHYIVKLEKIPLTPNGKTDRNNLPDPHNNFENENNYEAPINNTEKTLVKLWEEILKIEKIGINDNFFDLGGDSLKAIRMISCTEKLGYDLQYNTLITYPTIKELAGVLSEKIVDLGSKSESAEYAEDIIKREFAVDSQLIEYTVDDDIYNILYLYTDVDPYMKKQIIDIIAQKCLYKIWPHYIIFVKDSFNKMNHNQKISKEEFFKIINGSKDNFKYDIYSIIEELNRKESKFVHEIIDQEVVDTFPCSAIQKGTSGIMNGHLTGIILPIDLLVEEDIILEGLKNIILNQQLLRCAIYQENGDMVWKEFKAPKDITIPFIDISGFDRINQDEIIREIVKRKYFTFYFDFGSIHYRFILVKENLRSYKLIAPIDHILFDAMSSEIIVRNLKEYISGYSLKKKNSVVRYKDYVKQLAKGPVNISSDELIKIFNLKEYKSYADSIEKFIMEKDDNEPCSMEFKISLNDINKLGGGVWEISFFFTVLLSKWIFKTEKIPLKLFYYGRSYEEQDYYDLVGYFIDFIPLLINVDEDDINSTVDQVKNIINLAKKYNVNFVTLAFLKELEEKWGKVHECYKSTKLSESDQMLLYNFQGKRESYEKVKDYYDLGKSYFDDYRLEGSSFSIVSYYTNEYLCLSVLSKFKFNENEIRNKLENKLDLIIRNELN